MQNLAKTGHRPCHLHPIILSWMKKYTSHKQTVSLLLTIIKIQMRTQKFYMQLLMPLIPLQMKALVELKYRKLATASMVRLILILPFLQQKKEPKTAHFTI